MQTRRLPTLRYPSALPITARRGEIVELIREHQVVIVAGETGSGKSTQLPKMCLEAGRGVERLIGHTQPRRIAARAVAERVAEELDTRVGELVGYTVRFTDRVSDDTLIRVMTDGILLADLQRDPKLRRYDTIIVDEAHERSLNIDFILGYLRQLLPHRPDLRVIVTSATIDTARFAAHFGGAPVVEVSGRTYPVEVRYRPFEDPDDDRDQPQAICDAVEELWTEGPGDILVFLSGEREIRDTADALGQIDLPETEILPLYARLSAAEQHRVFESHPGRRVVLATNVAETSLTVPGIRYVVDPGTARVSRYSHRTKVQRLPIEPVSQASANQRSGRCGRVAPGVCIRLYSEEDFGSRPAFTEPEILRTNLASVVLQMSALGLGDIADFPFVEAPDRRTISDGLALLVELGAIDSRNELTPLGRRLARLPLDPRLGRIVLEAGRNGCLSEVIVIVAALSITDPRERPADRRKAADEQHSRFADADSDFLSYLNLWNYLRDRQKEMSSSQFRKLCRAEFLNYVRVREWQDIVGQLRDVTKGHNRKPADPKRIHMSLLAGLLSHMGWREGPGHEYTGARGARFALSPGSALFGKPPRWVMAGELVETTRLWAHDAARIQPDWAERLAQHLVTRSHDEPVWNPHRGSAVANETVKLYGLPIVTGRKVDYGRVDPGTAREMFILHALVRGEWRGHHDFLRHNKQVLEDLRALEDRARRRHIVIGEDELFDFYERRIPIDIVSGESFGDWWDEKQKTDPHLLDLTPDDAIVPSAPPVQEEQYPDTWHEDDLTFQLSYQFDPGSETDGVTVDIPLPHLPRVAATAFDWLVPGMREELVTTLIRSLPKDQRRRFVPAQEHARAFLAEANPDDGPIRDTLGRWLGVHATAFQEDRIPDHLRMTFRITDPDGTVVAQGRDLHALKAGLQPDVWTAVADAGRSLERSGITEWDFDALPRTFEAPNAVKAFPALADEDDSVAIRLFPTEAEQRCAMRAGTRRLLLLTIAPATRDFKRILADETKLALARLPGTLDDCIAAAIDTLVDDRGGPVWEEEPFRDLQHHVRYGLMDAVEDVADLTGQVLVLWSRIDARLGAERLPPDARDDMRRQVRGLVYPGFVTATGAGRLPDILRYLRAIDHRLDKLPEDPLRDDDLMERAVTLEHEIEADTDDLRWMLEEFRVSLFAQHLGTAYRVSEKRIREAIGRANAAT